jgi:peptidyl-prolyl cis-trans isomerase D
MTMLDRMRRHRNWLKWSLALVCLAFVIFYIPDFIGGGTNGMVPATGTVATVEGREIREDEFRRTYQQQLQAYRSAYGGNMTEQLLRQLGVDRQILQQMIDARAALAEAERLGIRATDQEVARQISSMPAFQENGAFVGELRYRQFLASQRPPMTPAAFEETVREALTVDKLRTALTGWLSVGDAELEREYRRRNETVKVALATINADAFRSGISVSDADVAKHFEANQETYRVPEKRKVRYLLVDVDRIREKTVVPQADIERAYNDNIQQYSTQEQIRASHILLKTEGRDEAAVKGIAEDILKKAKAPGADFDALARAHSEDETTAKTGGDLDYFGRGRMVPEFDAVAFTMEPGQVSDLVKTQFGFHIIKLIDKKAGTVQPLAEVRAQITDQIAMERAQLAATELATRLAGQIQKPGDLDTVGKANDIQVQESGMFAQNEPILGLGASPAVAARAFDLADGQVSEQLQTARGFVFFTVSGKQASYLPKIDEVRERVRNDLTGSRAEELAKQKAAELAPKLKTGDFEKTAKAGGAEVKTSESVTRDGSLPEIGSASEVLDRAFALPQGGVSDPITVPTGIVIVKVLEKSAVKPEDFASRKDSFREELLTDRRNRFFTDYMNKAKQRMKIEINPEAVQRSVS